MLVICSECGLLKENHPRNKHKCRECWNKHSAEQTKKYRHEHPERTNEVGRKNARKYKERHPEKEKAKSLKRSRENGEINRPKYALWLKVYRALGSGSKEFVEVWKSICSFYENKCLCCGREGDYLTLEPDHVIPKSKGGEKKPENIQILCRNCNNKKHTKIIDYRTKVYFSS